MVRPRWLEPSLLLVFLLLLPRLHGQQKSTSQVPPRAHSPAATKASTPDPGSIRDGVYGNSYFHVSYKIPVSWVDRTQDVQPASDAGKGLVLLAIFERPPEASGETVNSAVVIAAEPATSYPGLKSAAEYFGPFTELATGKGFKVVNPPYEFAVSGKSLVRSDFSKALEQQTMQQASLAEMEKGYFVSFTFISGSHDEVEELAARLSLGSGPPNPPSKPRSR